MTAGTITAADIAIPGFADFTILEFFDTAIFGLNLTGWSIGLKNGNGAADDFRIAFTTTGFETLVGFQGSSVGQSDLNQGFSGIAGGDIISITPQVSAVPLPGTLPLFASGLAALGLLGWRRKKAQASA